MPLWGHVLKGKGHASLSPFFILHPFFYSSAWNTNVMAGAGAAILDHEGEVMLGLAEQWMDLWSL